MKIEFTLSCMNLLHCLDKTVHFWISGNRPDFRSPRRRSARGGFSLIETALALGVVGFALISLLGMLPTGLQTFRKAMDFTLQTEMTQVLIGKANQMSFSSLSQLAAQPYYFDDNGNLVTADDATGTYIAHIVVASAVTLPAASSYSNTGVAQVTITFSRKRAVASSPPLGTVVTYIAAMTGSSSQ
jgi:uncharacterized protein (TIGR02598 family)